ncbi:hypothetical protein SteCoe_13675 [Stentor coeruleus]|uniref:Uncharacterized protein n=1 Tax=Stentor coeruleus TaxID=5963 RepID=A0A1R2C7U2_9CILI|nr:hypothetical protein SteCoe_13675 [Stentor coeruleus]
MKKIENQTEKLRCQSTGTSQNSSVSSILKDPGKSKPKHNRSVRFEEPDDIPKHNDSYELPQACANQVSVSPNNSFTSSISPSRKKLYGPSPTVTSIKKGHRPSKSEIVSSDYANLIYTPIKIVNITKLQKPPEPCLSPKFHPKTLKYDFRTQDFYQKLNRFINGKTETRTSAEVVLNKNDYKLQESPEKNVNTSFVQEVKKEKNISGSVNVNRSFEASSSTFGSGRSPSKKIVKNVCGNGKRPVTSINVKYSKTSGLNVLN